MPAPTLQAQVCCPSPFVGCTTVMCIDESHWGWFLLPTCKYPSLPGDGQVLEPALFGCAVSSLPVPPGYISSPAAGRVAVGDHATLSCANGQGSNVSVMCAEDDVWAQVPVLAACAVGVADEVRE